MKTENKREFSFEEKIKIWLHYVASVSFLNHDLLEVDYHKYSENHFGKDCKKLIKYPILMPNIMLVEVKTKSKARNFDGFCEEEDSRVSSGLIGYYWRFKNQIGI